MLVSNGSIAPGPMRKATPGRQTRSKQPLSIAGMPYH
jgi:hypothetical protein